MQFRKQFARWSEQDSKKGNRFSRNLSRRFTDARSGLASRPNQSPVKVPLRWARHPYSGTIWCSPDWFPSAVGTPDCTPCIPICFPFSLHAWHGPEQNKTCHNVNRTIVAQHAEIGSSSSVLIQFDRQMQQYTQWYITRCVIVLGPISADIFIEWFGLKNSRYVTTFRPS